MGNISIDCPVVMQKFNIPKKLESIAFLTLHMPSSALQNQFELTLSQALGMTGKKEVDPLASSRLNKVTQLTGFSDPVYAEAYVNVNQYDIVLDVLIVNQTTDTLQNLTLELATLGMKIMGCVCVGEGWS